LTGTRDLHFSFENRLDAEHAVHRLKQILSDADYKWAIVLWGGDGSHRTLAMGQSEMKEETE
jgi:muramoyltetrapeptide carboxypeptidase LdcA involved in peptidoglycan recycling